jgi:hypothetical protein
MKPFWTVLFLVAGVLGCRVVERQAATSTDSVALVHLREERFQPRDYATAGAAPVLLGFSASGKMDVAPITLPDAATSMIIRTATASIEVDSLEPAVAELKLLAARLGGYVANSGIEAGRNRLRQAVIEVKIPAARFEEVVSGLRPLGKLESVNVSAQDVGEEYVDVNARIENARRLERRLIDLLATRTGKLRDVLDVEQALARVREEIERYEGRVRYLRAHTATSTLSVTLHEPLPIVVTAGRGPMGEALRQAWRNFVALSAFAVQSLGVIVPLGLVAVACWILTRRWRMARQRTA